MTIESARSALPRHLSGPPTRAWNGFARSAGTACLALALFATGAAHALMAGDPPDSPQARVDANTAQSPWAGVVSLSIGTATFTGVAVSQWHVLTAAHPVAAARQRPVAVSVNVNLGGTLTHRIPADEIEINPAYAGYDPARINVGDLAIVRLALPLPAGVTPYRLWARALPQGTVLTIVGYGASGQGEAGAMVAADPGVKRIGRNAADRFILQRGRPVAYLFDFDGPGSGNGPLGARSLGNEAETMLATGDSGSPAFIMVRGQPVLVGINTLQLRLKGADGVALASPPRFGSGGGGMLVSTYVRWIARTIAGTLADAEPDAEEAGSAGESGTR